MTIESTWTFLRVFQSSLTPGVMLQMPKERPEAVDLAASTIYRGSDTIETRKTV